DMDTQNAYYNGLCLFVFSRLAPFYMRQLTKSSMYDDSFRELFQKSLHETDNGYGLIADLAF
ncbi:hypothetical protein V1523DRAFT_338540, partial [Lipomyces doorenjongii]